MDNQQPPSDQTPTPPRQAELEARYTKNLENGKPPYAGVKIRNVSELEWILHKRDWSGDRHIGGKRRPDLRETHLYDVNLKHAKLFRAQLDGADLAHANLEGADLRAANLMGVRLWHTRLAGADLREVILDGASRLRDMEVDDHTRFSDVAWNNAQVTRVEWPARLGDELDTKKGNRRERASAVRDAARAYRGLALALRQQGLLQRASDYRVREQQLERHARWIEGNVLAWVGLGVLELLAGYGERLGRIFVAYALIVLVFAAGFLAADMVAGQIPLTAQHALDALQISLNAVHGRVFFAQFHLDTLQSWLATAESIVGIVIEGIFVAMLIQRFFGR